MDCCSDPVVEDESSGPPKVRRRMMQQSRRRILNISVGKPEIQKAARRTSGEIGQGRMHAGCYHVSFAIFVRSEEYDGTRE